jgi:omega-6 fatty acid desaturase (delta-12 desaturase)
MITKPCTEDRLAWRSIVCRYEQRSDARALLQLATTAAPLVAVLILSERLVTHSPWAALALSVPAACLLIRAFIIMHDCAHGSFFSSRRLNNLLGWLAGVVTITPFSQWRRDHALHHASAGDLSRRGHGDVKTLTVREFVALSRLDRWRYRVLRHPAVLLGLGPMHLIFTQRITPPRTPLADPQTRSVWSTNVGIACLLSILAYTLGWRVLALTYLPAIYAAASGGIWLFFVQHQFEETYWADHGEWDYLTAAIRGSSYLKLPAPLRWVTGSIGVHHVHHLSPRIPNYRLQQCHDENPLFRDVTSITWRDGFRAFRLSLWDEEHKRLVGFSDVTRHLLAEEL